MADTSSEMPYTYHPPSGGQGGTYIKAGIVISVGVFLALFIVTESARTAATVMLLFSLAGSTLLIGWVLGHKSATRAMEIQSQTLAQAMMLAPPQITAQQSAPQLPAPRDRDGDLLSVDDSMMVSMDQIKTTASKIYHRMYPHTEPTQANIKEVFPSLTSHGYITKCMEYLKARGLVEGGGQGREYKWIVKE